MPGTFFGSRTLTPPIMSPLPSATAFSAASPVDGGDVVAVALRRGDLELAGGALGVVAGPEHPAVGDLLAGVAEVPVERRHQDLASPATSRRSSGRSSRRRRRPCSRWRTCRSARYVPFGIGIEKRDAIIEYSVFGVTNAEPWLPETFGTGPKICFVLKSRRSIARDAAVHVVDEEPAAVVVAVGLRERGMVHVAPGEVAEHRLRLVVEAVARRRDRG